MAWNEPGGGDGNNRDPWGNNNQGPPDLDEALKKLQERLGGLFGGGRRGGSGAGGGGKGLSGALLAIVLAGAAIIWGLMGFYQVDEQERAVVLRFGKFHDTVTPGLQWNPPLVDEVYKVNVTGVRSAAFRETMLTKDENIVEVKLSVQYRIDDPQKFVLEVQDPERSLQHATQSALRHVVGDSAMDLVLTGGRAVIAAEVKERTQRYLDAYGTGIRLTVVNVDDAQPPAPVQAAFDDVIKAREDEERVKNEAQAYANGIIPEARGAAQRQLEEANAYKEQVIANAFGEADRFNKLLAEYQKAPVVTRERLYLDAVQGVFSNTSKVMIDVEGGNNMMYLPLDKIVNESSQRSRGTGATLDRNALREITNQVTEQIRRDAATQRNARGGR